MERDSALKRKKVLTPATPWMSLEDTVLSDRSQWQKDKHCLNPLIQDTQRSQVPRDRRQNGGRQGLGEGQLVLHGAEFQFGERRELWGWTVVMVAQHRECT